jgi:hypothetical protein
LDQTSGRLGAAAHRSGALVHRLDRVVDRLCNAGRQMDAPVGRMECAVRELVLVADSSDVIDGWAMGRGVRATYAEPA